MEQISAIVDRVTCTTYTTVRPVLSSSVPETQSSVPEVGTGHANSDYDAQQHFQVTIFAASCTLPAILFPYRLLQHCNTHFMMIFESVVDSVPRLG